MGAHSGGTGVSADPSLGNLDNLAEIVAEREMGCLPGVLPDNLTIAVDCKKDELNVRVPATAGGQPPQGGTPTRNARQLWDQAVGLVENMTADHARAAAEIAIRAPNQLAVIFSAKYNFSKAFCERPDRLAKLEEAVE